MTEWYESVSLPVRNRLHRATNIPLHKEEYFSSVRNLSLADLKLVEFPSFISKMPNLTSLDLSHNYINTVDFSLLPPRLEFLDLSDNELTEIDLSSLPVVNNLGYLSLEMCKLSNLPAGMEKAAQLYDLKLRKNNIKSIQTPLSLAPNLVELDLTENGLANINISGGELNNLVTLKLKGNELRSVPLSLWESKYLGYLDITSNPLRDWEFLGYSKQGLRVRY